jgi:hypothetical protein
MGQTRHQQRKDVGRDAEKEEKMQGGMTRPESRAADKEAEHHIGPQGYRPAGREARLPGGLDQLADQHPDPRRPEQPAQRQPRRQDRLPPFQRALFQRQRLPQFLAEEEEE